MKNIGRTIRLWIEDNQWIVLTVVFIAGWALGVWL